MRLVSPASKYTHTTKSSTRVSTGKPLLITGPAASGKSTLTKQYACHLAKLFVEASAVAKSRRAWLVPLRITVLELAKTMESEKLTRTDDILAEHINKTFNASPGIAAMLLEMRDQRRLLVVLDGIDECAGARTELEPYIGKKLAHEVLLCLTGRDHCVRQTALFEAFVQFRIQLLTNEQQRFIAAARLSASEVRKGEIPLDERVENFMEHVLRDFSEVARTPLLLNMLISEHLRHEQLQRAIQFDGRIVHGQTEYIASFPGMHFVEWGRVTQVMKDKSVACVFIPGNSPLYGVRPCIFLCHVLSLLNHDSYLSTVSLLTRSAPDSSFSPSHAQ